MAVAVQILSRHKRQKITVDLYADRSKGFEKGKREQFSCLQTGEFPTCDEQNLRQGRENDGTFPHKNPKTGPVV